MNNLHLNINKPMRNSNVELLRFILMNMILIWHTFVHGFDFKGEGDPPEALQYLLMVITASSVNCFMLISGYYGIRFSWDKLLNIIFQTLGVCLLWQVLAACMGNGYGFTLNNFFLYFFPISSSLWWFMPCYVIILVLSPLINQGVASIERQKFQLILFLLVFYHSYSRFIAVHSFYTGLDFIWMLTVYLIGRYLGMYKITISKSKSLALWSMSVFVVYIIGLLGIYSGTIRLYWIILCYHNFFILTAAIAVLCFTLSFKERFSPFINLLGRHCLFIFLFTEIIGTILYKRIADIFSYNMFLGLCFVFVICFACILIDMPLSYVNTKLRTFIIDHFNRSKFNTIVSNCMR